MNFDPHKTVLLDADGILFDLHQKVAGELQLLLDRPVSARDCRSNSPSVGFAHLHEHARTWVTNMLAWPKFFRDLPLMPHAVEGVQFLMSRGYRPVILSSYGTAPQCVPDKDWAISQHFPFIHPRDRIYSSCKSLVQGALFLDDGAEHLAEWKRLNPTGTTVTIKRPYTMPNSADICLDTWLDVSQLT